MFVLVAVSLLLCCYFAHFVLISRRKRCPFISKNQKVLLVTAHPDDECMFFAPTILDLVRNGYELHLLCLSTGGFYKQSLKRKKELRKSCHTLGIPAGNLTIIQHSHLPDNPSLKWSRVIVGSIIHKYIIRLSVDCVISFDDLGVSGHLNHIAICEGLRYLHFKKLLPEDCEVFLLESVHFIRKYTGFLLSPFSYFFSSLSCVSAIDDIQTIRKSMQDHKSQYVWFRKLYIVFSKYVYDNTFVRL